MTYQPVMLMILDGWGVNKDLFGNAIGQANKPCYDALLDRYPYAELEASGEFVGLPEGQMGNSEVGHLNMGAGRVVYQELTRINKAVREGSFQTNPELTKAMEKAVQEKKNLHLLGLLSDGGVHSNIEHLYALLEMAREKKVENVFIHVLLDGRDVPPANAGEYITALEEKMRLLGVGEIATIAGRYYTMDRDHRWERVEKGYLAMVEGVGLKACMAMEALHKSYEMKVTDEFLEPTVIVDSKGEAVGKIRPGDVMIMFNFRADRAREITHAFVDREFTPFQRPGGYLNLTCVCLTQYEVSINAPVAFPPQNLENTLGEVISRAGLKQLRIAETEKYAHVTFFFNGGVEEANAGEERVLIPSPKVATYNLQPEMSAFQVSDKVIGKVENEKYDLIVLNYANADMVGHTGQMDACIIAIEAVDTSLGRVVDAVLKKGGAVLLTADHGNAEQKIDPENNQPLTAHTSNKVPVILAAKGTEGLKLRNGSLQDIAPTVLELIGLPKPPEMTGKSLLVKE